MERVLTYHTTEDLHSNERTQGVDECERIDELEAKRAHHCFVGKDNAACTDHLHEHPDFTQQFTRITQLYP